MHVKKVLKFGMCAAAFLLCTLSVTAISNAEPMDEFDFAYTDEVRLIKGELATVKVDSLTRVSVTDPFIADIVDADSESLLMVGKAVGHTALFIWDERGKRTVMVYVFNQSLDIVQSRIRELLDSADIGEVELRNNEQEGKVVVLGDVPEHKMDLFNQIIEKFRDDTINMVGEEVAEDLIEIDMQITELNTTLQKSLGVDWATGGTSGIAPVYTEDTPNFDGHIRDFFKIGHFSRTGQLTAAVDALITEGKARILSKPKLVVISGEEASFLVGGEVPIRTTTFSDTGSSQENVSFKSFGISMTITPTIKKKRVDIIMNLEVSEIDASTASSVSESVAFSTRSASTHLYLDDGQTIILAGLIKHTDSENVSRVPFASKLPFFGMFFRSRSNPVANKDEELVISLTPHILAQENADDRSMSRGNGEAASPQVIRSRRFAYQKPAPHYIGVPQEMTNYVHEIQQKISQSIVYPADAKRYGWEGTVKVGALILNDGTLAVAMVKESSGRDIFDEVALDTTKQSAPFMAFPSDTDLQELSITIPIVYSLSND